jgi:hypothetical protein
VMRVHKLTLETLERLLFDTFRQTTGMQSLIDDVKSETSQMMEEPSYEVMQCLTQNMPTSL